MANPVQYAVEFTIKEGGLEEFKNIASQIIPLVEANEPLMLGYQWYFSDDGSKCFVVEQYSDASGILAHLQNVGGELPKILEFSDLTRFEVYGDVSDEIKEALAPLGATFHSLWNGFAR
jgi:quinol monooxygenase YgiN